MTPAIWSLTGEVARCAYGLKTGASIPGRAKAYKAALEISKELKAAETFEQFLQINQIEIID